MNARAPDRPPAVDGDRAGGRVAVTQADHDLVVYERDCPPAWIQSSVSMEVRR